MKRPDVRYGQHRRVIPARADLGGVQVAREFRLALRFPGRYSARPVPHAGGRQLDQDSAAPPPRGLIFDPNGFVAGNEQNYRIPIGAGGVGAGDVQAVLHRLSHLVR